MKECKPTPRNTIDKAMYYDDYYDIVNLYTEKAKWEEFTECDLMDFLEVAFRWGYKAGNADTVRNCYKPLLAYVDEAEDGNLSLVFEDEEGEKHDRWFIAAEEAETRK